MPCTRRTGKRPAARSPRSAFICFSAAFRASSCRGSPAASSKSQRPCTLTRTRSRWFDVAAAPASSSSQRNVSELPSCAAAKPPDSCCSTSIRNPAVASALCSVLEEKELPEDVARAALLPVTSNDLASVALKFCGSAARARSM